MEYREDDKRWAKFFAEDKGVDMDRALRCAVFHRLLLCVPATEAKGSMTREPWVQHGKVRYYFSILSQNNLPAVEGLVSAYYDADEDDVFIKRNVPGQTHFDSLREICKKKTIFSGAKTRRWVCEELAGRLYHETWARH